MRSAFLGLWVCLLKNKQSSSKTTITKRQTESPPLSRLIPLNEKNLICPLTFVFHFDNQQTTSQTGEMGFLLLKHISLKRMACFPSKFLRRLSVFFISFKATPQKRLRQRPNVYPSCLFS